MNYLKEKDLLDIEQNVRLFSVDEIEDISHYFVGLGQSICF